MNARVRLAVLGDPIAHSRSPELHRAGAAALGIECASEAIRTNVAELAGRLDDLAAAGYLGCNLTMPLKEAAVALVDRASDRARASRSINTVTFAALAREGDTTDGAGFVDWLRALGHEPVATTLVLLGGGGASRAIALALAESGAPLTLSVRSPDSFTLPWPPRAQIRIVGWRTDEARAAIAAAHVVVNATPLGTREPPVDPGWTSAGAQVLDLAYSAQPARWLSDCRARGLDARDGLGLLVHQARHSLSHWFGRDVPLEPLARAVGWSA